MQHDPDRMYLAKKISRAFRNDEDAVMKRLEEIYSTGGPKNLTFKDLPKPAKKLVQNSDERSVDHNNPTSQENTDNPVKKKGMLKKIIVLVLAIAVLGGGGYFGYAMFMGGDHDDSLDTHTEDSSHSAENPEASHENHSDDDIHQVSDSLIEDIESKIDQAEKDSIMKDLKDAADELHVLGL